MYRSWVLYPRETYMEWGKSSIQKLANIGQIPQNAIKFDSPSKDFWFPLPIDASDTLIGPLFDEVKMEYKTPYLMSSFFEWCVE